MLRQTHGIMTIVTSETCCYDHGVSRTIVLSDIKDNYFWHITFATGVKRKKLSKVIWELNAQHHFFKKSQRIVVMTCFTAHEKCWKSDNDFSSSKKGNLESMYLQYV